MSMSRPLLLGARGLYARGKLSRSLASSSSPSSWSSFPSSITSPASISSPHVPLPPSSPLSNPLFESIPVHYGKLYLAGTPLEGNLGDCSLNLVQCLY